MTRWKSFTVETRREAVDALSHFFRTHGSLGMAYDERLFGPNGDPADPLPPPEEVTKLTAYFPWEADLHDVKKAFLEFLPSSEFRLGGRSSCRPRRSATSMGGKRKEHLSPSSAAASS
jgi:ribosomal protein L11 methylase PrmA